MSLTSRVLWAAFGVIAMMFMVLPIGLVVLFSFGRSELAGFPMGGLTIDWYNILFSNKDFWIALENSAIIGLSVAVTSVISGTLAALAFARMDPRQSGPLLGALALPLMLPSLVLGLALATLYGRFSISLSLLTAIPGQVVFVQPFVILVVYARMATFDYAVIDSARDLGALPVRVFFTVTLPVIQPTIIGAALIAAAVSLDEFIITYHTIGGSLTLPTMIWGMLRTSLDPDINALASLIIGFTVTTTIIALRTSQYRG